MTVTRLGIGGDGAGGAQTQIAGVEPLPAVVEAVRAAGVRLRRVRGSLVGVCPVCARPTLYVGNATFTCFGCGVRGNAENAAERLRERKGRAA